MSSRLRLSNNAPAVSATERVAGRLKATAGAAIVLTNKTPLPAEVLGRLPELRYIGVLATGYNIVDVAAARERNIPVTNVPAYGTKSVTQMTFALLLELTQHAGGTDGELLTVLKRHFSTVKHAKPPASRKGSSEWYVVAQGFKGQRDSSGG